MLSTMAHKNKSNYSAYKARQKPKNMDAITAKISAPESDFLGVKKPSATSEKPGVAHPAKPKSKTLSKASKPVVQKDKPKPFDQTSYKLLGKHKRPDEIFSMEEANDRLYDVFKNHNFTVVNHDERKQLAHFYRLLMQNQKSENFTRLLTLKDVAIKHFIDSLVFLEFFQPQFPLLDLGTGPGFPGIPLKIKYPKEKILLGEGVQKRVSFLKTVREEMKLENLEIIGRNIDCEFVYPVKSVITRAVEDIGNTMKNTMNSLVDGGQLIFMKGPNADPELEIAKAYKEYYKLAHDFKYKIPNTPHERRLIVYTKIKSPPLQD